MSQTHAERAAEQMIEASDGLATGDFTIAGASLVMQGAQVSATLELAHQTARIAEFLESTTMGPNYAIWTRDAS